MVPLLLLGVLGCSSGMPQQIVIEGVLAPEFDLRGTVFLRAFRELSFCRSGLFQSPRPKSKQVTVEVDQRGNEADSNTVVRFFPFESLTPASRHELRPAEPDLVIRCDRDKRPEYAPDCDLAKRSVEWRGDKLQLALDVAFIPGHVPVVE